VPSVAISVVQKAFESFESIRFCLDRGIAEDKDGISFKDLEFLEGFSWFNHFSSQDCYSTRLIDL